MTKTGLPLDDHRETTSDNPPTLLTMPSSTEEKLAELKLQNMARTEAARSLQLLQEMVKPLEDDRTKFIPWMARFKRHAAYQEFPPWILDFSQSRPNKTTRSKLPLRDQYHEKNAYEAVLNLCSGHPVELELRSVEVGDGQGAFQTVFNHYFESTPEGIGQASRDFYRLSMDTTDCTLCQFITLIITRADILQLLTQEEVSDRKRVVQLMGGLLPDFKGIALIINNWEASDRTMKKCSAKLLSFAKSERLTTRTRAGDARARNKTYHQTGAKPSPRTTAPPWCYTAGKDWCGDRWMGDTNDCHFEYPADRGGNRRQPEQGGRQGGRHPTQGSQQGGRHPTPKVNTVRDEPPVALCSHCGEQSTHWTAKCPVHPSSLAGMNRAMKEFYNMTMSNTNLNVGQFMALARRRACILRRLKHEVTDTTVLTIIYGGLPTEYRPVQLFIEDHPELSLDQCVDRIEGFAGYKSPGSSPENCGSRSPAYGDSKAHTVERTWRRRHSPNENRGRRRGQRSEKSDWRASTVTRKFRELPSTRPQRNLLAK